MDFLISSSIVIGFIVLIVLVTNYMLMLTFGFNESTFPIITITLLALGIGMYLFLSKSLLDPLFKSDEQIQNLIKETLHELNTPVATIQINTQMIKRKEENSKNIKRLEKIEKSCENLLNLYKQMEYDIKKEVDSIIIEEFSLSEIIEESINAVEDIKQKIEIKNNITQQIILQTDKNGFIKVINNLIINAIKYNKPNGYVKLYMNNDTLCIQDNGIGIDSDSLFQVFDKYYQQNLEHKGIGLGLNIVKEFCDKHKVKINIESYIDNGTTIYLDIKQIIKD